MMKSQFSITLLSKNKLISIQIWLQYLEQYSHTDSLKMCDSLAPWILGQRTWSDRMCIHFLEQNFNIYNTCNNN